MDANISKAIDEHIAHLDAIRARGDSATSADLDALAASAAAIKALTAGGKAAPASKDNDDVVESGGNSRSTSHRPGSRAHA